MAYPYTPPVPQFGLANQANQFMQQQARLPFLMNLPGYASSVGQRGTNTLSMLQGNVPADVVQQIQQRGAERGVATGVRGDSPNANASWLRALGLTSLGLQQQGSQQLSQSIQDTPQAALWNPMSLYVPQVLSKSELDVAQGGADSVWKPWADTITRSRFTSPSGSML